MICDTLTIFFLSMTLIIILFTFTFCPLLQLLQCFKLFGQTGFASGNIRTVFEIIQKIGTDLEKIQTFLKPSRTLTIIWKNPDSFETVQKIRNDLEKFGQF